MLPYIVIGVVTGSIYAIAGLGLTLTYKTSGIFNFGYGAIATGAVLIFYQLHVEAGVAWPLAAFVAVIVYGVVAGVLMERLAVALSTVPTTLRIVGTVGLILVVQGVSVVLYGAESRPIPSFLPTHVFRLPGVNVTVDQIITVAVAGVAAVGLIALFRYTRTGVAMRGVVDDADLLDMTGLSPTEVRRTAWIIGCCFASVSGILLAATIGLDAVLLILLVVQAFGAAAIGRFTNLGLTYVGGIGVGVIQALAVKYVSTTQSLALLPSSMPFLVLFVVLVISKRGTLVELGQTIRNRPAPPIRISPSTRNGLAVAAAVLVGAIPFLVGTKLPIYTTALAEVILFLSLSLLVHVSGQISLCQVGFAAIGAAAFGHFTHGFGLPWLLALVLAGLIVIPVGVLIAIPAIRLAGLYLALATLGFGILLAQVGYGSFLMFGTAGVQAPRPKIPGIIVTSDRWYYYVVMAVALVAMGVVILVQRSRLGRLLRALGESPEALTVNGANANITRVIVFCLSSFLAGISGAVAVSITGFSGAPDFQYLNSLIVLAVLVICGKRSLVASSLAALLYIVVPGYITNPSITKYEPIFFGGLALAIAVFSYGSPAREAVRTASSRMSSHRAILVTSTMMRNRPKSPADRRLTLPW
jgi:ABC-type branched-subunit amino acid transport system permease subunit